MDLEICEAVGTVDAPWFAGLLPHERQSDRVQALDLSLIPCRKSGRLLGARGAVVWEAFAHFDLVEFDAEVRVYLLRHPGERSVDETLGVLNPS